MSELKLSITILVSYIIMILGIANIDAFQESVIDFSPMFFLFVAVIVSSELIVTGWLIKQGLKYSYYSAILFWVVVYIIAWVVVGDKIRPVQTQLIQFLLVALSAGLSYDVGKRIGQVDNALNGLSSGAFPNRARELTESHDLVSSEITRSRRYHHPLSILVLRLSPGKDMDRSRKYDALEKDMLDRFAVAKMSQIVSDLARVTDVVLRDKGGEFVLLCPETNFAQITILAERVALAVHEELKSTIDWGGAMFPDEALTFDELLQIARNRYAAFAN